MSIAERLAIAMRKNGISSAMQLANLSGVSQTMISRILRGGASPTVDTLEMLCAGMGIKIEEFYKIGDTPTLDEQLSDIDFALSGEIRDLTDDEKQDILDYVRFKRSQKKGR